MAKRVNRVRRETRNTRRAETSARTTTSARPGDPQTPSDAGSVHHQLARLLDTPFLARVVPHLAPETLHQLIRHRGLDACGEIVASATPEQLTSVLDLDLWPSAQPGRDERFDEDRFGEWIELLVESGDTVAVRILAAIDEDLLVAGLSRHVRVFDAATFEPTAATDDEPMAGARSFDGLECEVGGYVVRAKRPDAWDAIVTVMLALDANDSDRFHAVMQECRRLSNSAPEIDGLDDLLMEPAQQLHDVALEREHRRSRLGYSTPADARAFLEMARRPPHQRPNAASAINPLAAAYFRAADEAEAETRADLTRSSQERALEPWTDAGHVRLDRRRRRSAD